MNNADRKGGHCLLGEDGRIWAIDHGVCFHEDPKLRTVIWEYMDEPIPQALVDRLGVFGEALASGMPLRERLDTLLSDEEVDAMAAGSTPSSPDPVPFAARGTTLPVAARVTLRR